jgi:hypothetical protein
VKKSIKRLACAGGTSSASYTVAGAPDFGCGGVSGGRTPGMGLKGTDGNSKSLTKMGML